MNEKRLNEIHARLEGATPTDLEPTFRDEIWFIRHIEEIILAYRQDIPDLLDALQAAEQRATEAERIIEIALEERYQEEVVDTEMEDLDIGEDGYYADKSDWLDSRLDEWKQVATIDTAEGKE